MLAAMLNGTSGAPPVLPGPITPTGFWFYVLVFLVILLGAVFIITPVPENSLLFVAGALAVSRQVSLAGVLVASVAGAYIGYDLNYWTGRLFSFAACRRVCPHILQEKNMERARALLERFGPASVVISRFIPAVNLPPFFAGLDAMDYGRYVVANLAGAILWCGITVFLGYYIGAADIIQDYLNPLLDLVVLVTIATLGYAAARLVWERKRNRDKTPA